MSTGSNPAPQSHFTDTALYDIFLFMASAPVESGSLRNGDLRNEGGELYTPDHVAKLLIGSFKYSQKDGRVTQDQILRYIASRFRARLDDAIIDTSFTQTYREAQRIINDPTLHKPGYKGAGTEVYMAMNGLRLRLRERLEPDIPLLTRRIITLDNRSIAGRDRQDPDPSNPDRDPHASYFTYHGLMRQSTGLAEYDQMFAELVAEYEDHTSEKSIWRESVSRIVESYISYHPEYVNDIPESYRPVHTLESL